MSERAWVKKNMGQNFANKMGEKKNMGEIFVENFAKKHG